MFPEKHIEKEFSRLESMGLITRKQFLKIMGAYGVLSLCHPQSASAKSSAKGRIVIVGGGAAGINVAARLKKSLDEADITIIDPSDRQYYQPGFTLIASGVYDKDEVWKPQEQFIPSGVKWVKDKVRLVEPEKNTVLTDGGERVAYDFLVLCPGAQVNWEKIEGITEKTLGEGNAHSIYCYEGAQKMWPAMEAFGKKGGKGIFCDTHTKHKCGGAPKKMCLLSWDNARKNNNLDHIDIKYYTAEKQLYDVPFYTKRLEEIYKERHIPVETNIRLTGVDTQSKTAYFNRYETRGEDTVITSFKEDYDLLHFMAPQSAPDFVKESGLSWTEGKLAADGWAMTDSKTLLHKTYSNIVCLGDCAGIPTSKTSAAIAHQAPIAVKNLISVMEGKEPEAEYNGYAACPIVTDYGHVLLCEFDYEKKEQVSFPFTLLDMSKEQWAAWLLKVYMLKPIYFHLMLKGLY